MLTSRNPRMSLTKRKFCKAIKAMKNSENGERFDQFYSTSYLDFISNVSTCIKKSPVKEIYQVLNPSINRISVKSMPKLLFPSTKHLQSIKKGNSQLDLLFKYKNIEYPRVKSETFSPKNINKLQLKTKLPLFKPQLTFHIDDQFDSKKGKEKIKIITQTYTGITPKIVSKISKISTTSQKTTQNFLMEKKKLMPRCSVVRRKYYDDGLENA